MNDKVLLWVILGLTAATFAINVKFAMVGLEAQGQAEEFKKNPLNFLLSGFIPARK